MGVSDQFETASDVEGLDIELMNTLQFSFHVVRTFVDLSLSSSHIQPVAKMSFHWPFLHSSASTAARDHFASSVLLEFHRCVPGVTRCSNSGIMFEK